MSAKIPTDINEWLYTVDALPKGACSAGEACTLFAVATCPCDGGFSTGGSLDYACTCDNGQWACALFAQGATACVCPAFDGGS